MHLSLRSLTSVSEPLLWLGLAFSTACAEPAHGASPAEAPLPKVSAATPLTATLTEYTEHTGRVEAPETVEIRARASGYLERSAFREGDLVNKGDLLFVIDPRPYQAALARAKAELESLRADREVAQKNAERADHLLRTSALSQREWDSQHALVHTLAARMGVASAAVREAELALEYAYVRSPISGRVGRMLVTPGNLVGPDTASPLTTVVSVDPLYVYVELDEARALQLGREPNAAAQVGFPGESGTPHAARLDFFDNHVDPGTGTLRVRAVVDNPEGRFTHGLFARMRIPEGTEHPALLISDRAVAADQDRRHVWVVGEGDKIAYRAVTLGPLSNGLRVVRQGVGPSDRVVVRGLARARPGVKVQAEPIAMDSVDELATNTGRAL